MSVTDTSDRIARFGKSIFDRGLTAGTSGNISVRIDDGWLMTPTNVSLGRLDPARIAKLDANDTGNSENLPFAVICAVHADYDPRSSPGIGGQMPVQNGLFITFVLSAWIRELGFRAIVVRDGGADALAARARLGTVNGQGRLVTREFAAGVYVADAIYTDLPLAVDN